MNHQHTTIATSQKGKGIAIIKRRQAATTTTTNYRTRKYKIYPDMTMEKQRKLRVRYINAVNMNKMKIVRDCIDRNVPVNAQNELGWTTLHTACVRGYFDMVKYLTKECHIDIYKGNNFGFNALHKACCRRDRVEIVKFLVIECNMNIQIQNDFGANALHYVSEYGCIELVKFFIEECDTGSIDVPDNDGYTALHRAMKMDRFDVVRYLLEECHVDVTLTTNDHKNVFDFACDSQHRTYIVMKLLERLWAK